MIIYDHLNDRQLDKVDHIQSYMPEVMTFLWKLLIYDASVYHNDHNTYANIYDHFRYDEKLQFIIG